MKLAHTFHALALCSFLSLVAGCREDHADTAASTAEVNGGAHVPRPGTPERAAVVAGLHAVLDPDLHGQPNELVIGNNMHVHGSWAYVTGIIQGKGGAKIDWKNTVYKAAIEGGFFDGSNFTAVLVLNGSTWSVAKDGDGRLTYAVGPTDVREVGWIDALGPKGLPFDLFPQGMADSFGTDTLHTPATGSAEQDAIAKGLHGHLDPDFDGQETAFVFETLRVHNGWAFVVGSIQGKGGGAIDWKRTTYADRIAAGAWDGPSVLAVLRQQIDGSWYVPTVKLDVDELPTAAVGPTDFPASFWASELTNRGVPGDLFPW